MTVTTYSPGDRIEIIPGESSVIKGGEFEVLEVESNGLHYCRRMDTGTEIHLDFTRIQWYGGVVRKIND